MPDALDLTGEIAAAVDGAALRGATLALAYVRDDLSPARHRDGYRRVLDRNGDKGISGARGDAAQGRHRRGKIARRVGREAAERLDGNNARRYLGSHSRFGGCAAGSRDHGATAARRRAGSRASEACPLIAHLLTADAMAEALSSCVCAVMRQGVQGMRDRGRVSRFQKKK